MRQRRWLVNLGERVAGPLCGRVRHLANPMTSPPDQFEHYELLKNPDGSRIELGRGSMGITYKALDTNLHCPVALKMINASYLNEPRAEERFLREARGAARLRHRHVASVFHLGRCGDAHFYAMEYIEGETVDALVKRDGPMAVAQALEIASQVASALAAAHQQALVHRDIKPSNLMLSRESDGELTVKVIDFGLVKSAMISTVGGEQTSSGFVGTPYFASPEQLDQRAEDIRSDIYSLGVTLWFMLTGKPTFLGSVASVIVQHLERTPSFDSLAVLPAEVVLLLRKMLEKDVAKRFQTPAELRADIKRCLANLRPGEQTLAAGRPVSDAQAVTLSSSRGIRHRPRIGALLDGRYRLIEDLNPANPNRTFHGEDTVQKRRVRVKLVEDDGSLFGYLVGELAKLKSETNPHFIEVLAAARPATPDAPGYVVLEWIDGFSLQELLRVRHELTPREAVMLLKQIARAIDEARRRDLKPELGLRDILLDFPERFEEADREVMLRCPLAEWPGFVVKLNPLGRLVEFEALAEQTMVPGAKHGTEVVQIGRIAYDLLGGKSECSAPLATLPEHGNEILRRCIDPRATFASAGEFVSALSTAVNAESGSTTSLPSRSLAVSKAAPESREPAKFHVSTAQPLGRILAANGDAFQPRLSGPTNRGLIAAALVMVTVVSGAIWLWQRSREPGVAPISSATPAAITPKPLTGKKPPQPGKPWTNSLGSSFVPLDTIHFGKTETRVREFEAFVQATNYDAVGGMYSLQRDGFKQHGHSWKDPGFPQTADHPVVGVSWDDAQQFCAWLTQRERAEGALTARHVYRLATDREWSAAAGLSLESGATAEDRSGRLKDAYPWGKGLPPKAGAGNYAGAEARAGAPERWPTISSYQDGFARTTAAGSGPPNRRGVSDLGGNVWEWCGTAYNRTTNWRVLRGGSWATSRGPEMLLSFRRGFDPSFRHDDIGFRCVIALDEGER